MGAARSDVARRRRGSKVRGDQSGRQAGQPVFGGLDSGQAVCVQSVPLELRSPLKRESWIHPGPLQFYYGPPSPPTRATPEYWGAMDEWHGDAFRKKGELLSFRDWLFKRCQRVRIVDGLRTIEPIDAPY